MICNAITVSRACLYGVTIDKIPYKGNSYCPSGHNQTSKTMRLEGKLVLGK